VVLLILGGGKVADERQRVVSDFSSSQLGDAAFGDTAGGNIYKITASLDAMVELLQANIEKTELRVTALEDIARQFALERGSLMRSVTMLANESRSVRDIQEMLEKKLSSDNKDRDDRRKFLDRMLFALLIINLADIIVRVLRGSGRAA
jgi:hypothetical protein